MTANKEQAPDLQGQLAATNEEVTDLQGQLTANEEEASDLQGQQPVRDQNVKRFHESVTKLNGACNDLKTTERFC